MTFISYERQGYIFKSRTSFECTIANGSYSIRNYNICNKCKFLECVCAYRSARCWNYQFTQIVRVELNNSRTTWECISPDWGNRISECYIARCRAVVECITWNRSYWLRNVEFTNFFSIQLVQGSTVVECITSYRCCIRRNIDFFNQVTVVERISWNSCLLGYSYFSNCIRDVVSVIIRRIAMNTLNSITWGIWAATCLTTKDMPKYTCIITWCVFAFTAKRDLKRTNKVWNSLGPFLLQK